MNMITSFLFVFEKATLVDCFSQRQWCVHIQQEKNAYYSEIVCVACCSYLHLTSLWSASNKVNLKFQGIVFWSDNVSIFTSGEQYKKNWKERFLIIHLTSQYPRILSDLLLSRSQGKNDVQLSANHSQVSFPFV